MNTFNINARDMVSMFIDDCLEIVDMAQKAKASGALICVRGQYKVPSYIS